MIPEAEVLQQFKAKVEALFSSGLKAQLCSGQSSIAPSVKALAAGATPTDVFMRAVIVAIVVIGVLMIIVVIVDHGDRADRGDRGGSGCS